MISPKHLSPLALTFPAPNPTFAPNERGISKKSKMVNQIFQQWIENSPESRDEHEIGICKIRLGDESKLY